MDKDNLLYAIIQLFAGNFKYMIELLNFSYVFAALVVFLK
jgi:hypothetical protein